VKLPAFRRAPAAYDEAFMRTMAENYLERTPWTELRLSAVRDLVEPQEGERVLDLGCAAGAIAHFLSSFGCRVVGVDSEQLAIETARSLFPELEFVQADVAELPFEDGSFDKAVAADLVEHLDDETFARMLAETGRVLVPGGTLSIYTPNPKHYIERLKAHDFILAQNPTHIGLRDADTLVGFFVRAGYDVERSEWRPSFYRGVKTVERRAGSHLSLLRYRLCLRGRTMTQP
jgi:SAM-dependent methyltransferase